MHIVCPHCSTGYDLAWDALPPEGRKVRCARCGVEWLATPVFADETPYAALPPGMDAEIEAAFSDAFLDEDGEPRHRTIRPEPPRARRAAPPEAAPPPPEEPPPAPAPAPPPAAIAAVPARAVPKPVTISGAGTGFEHVARARPVKPVRPKAPGRPLRERLGVPSMMLVVLVLAGAVLARQPIVSAVPDLAGLYAAFGMGVNLRGLEFRNMTATRDIDNGRPILIVEGEIANIGSANVDVPPIRLAVRAGRQEIYAWSVEPARRTLGAGESAAFRTRLATPPAAADDIEIRFTPHRQLAAEAH
jgi:predicted Zn finger-like uncharacterized protein